MKKLRFISLICATAMAMSVTANANWEFDVVDITEHIESDLHEFRVCEENPKTFLYRYDPHKTGPDGHYTTFFQQSKTFTTNGSKVYDGEPITDGAPVTLSNGNKVIHFTTASAMIDTEGNFILEPFYYPINFINGRAITRDKRTDENIWIEIDENGSVLREFYSETNPNIQSDSDNTCISSYSAETQKKFDTYSGVLKAENYGAVKSDAGSPVSEVDQRYALTTADDTLITGYDYSRILLRNPAVDTYGLKLSPIIECRYPSTLKGASSDIFSSETLEKLDFAIGTDFLAADEVIPLSNGKFLLDVYSSCTLIVSQDGIIEHKLDGSLSHSSSDFIVIRKYDSEIENYFYTVYNNNGMQLTQSPIYSSDFNVHEGSLSYFNENNFYVIDTVGNILFTVPDSDVRSCSAISYGVAETIFADAIIKIRNYDFYAEHDYLDASGQSVFPKRYDEAWSVGNGAFVVKDGDKFLLLNAKENYALVRINNQFIETDQSAVVRDGRTLVPMRAIIEALGGTAAWSHREQTAYATINGKTIGFTIGDTHYKIDGEYYPLDVPAQIVNDRTMLPVRAIAEALGAEVGWNGYTRVVYISTNN